MKFLLILGGLLLLGAITWVCILRPGCGDCCRGGFRGAEAAEISKMLDRPADFLLKDVRIEGTIVRQCPHCACWLVVRDDAGRELKVEAGDLGEPLPYRPGRKAAVEGRLIRFGEGYEFVASALELH